MVSTSEDFKDTFIIEVARGCMNRCAFCTASYINLPFRHYEYEKIIDNGNSIKERAVQSLLSSVNTKGGIFVYNQSPFTVSDYIELDGKTYYAKEIPAHGWKVIKDIKSPEKIKTSDKIIENNLLGR